MRFEDLKPGKLFFEEGTTVFITRVSEHGVYGLIFTKDTIDVDV